MTSENSKIQRTAELLFDAQSAVAFTGAGVSTGSGIPDFRSPTSGLWEKADPMRVASLPGFRADPTAFYNWVRPLARGITEATPNAAHLVLARLQTLGKLRGIITQNIDGLHTAAGNDPVYELHGHMRTATCTTCFASTPIDDAIIAQIIDDGTAPPCTNCGGTLKPDVILFGEELPYAAYQAARRLTREADLLIVVGSSLRVEPANKVPFEAIRHGARLVILNLEPTPADGAADVVIHADVTHVLPRIVERLEKLL